MSDKRSKKEKVSGGVKISWSIPFVTLTAFLIILGISFFIRNNKKDINLTENVEPVVILEANTIKLPEPAYRSSVSIETTLKNVRPKRSYADENITLKDASQLLWAAQGVNVDWGDRTTPSAKSTYPLSIFIIVNKIEGINPGFYQYIPGEREMIHAIKPLTEGKYQTALYTSLNQNSMKNPSGVIFITGNMVKMAQAYGGIAHDKEVYLEAGHAAQNLYLQAESLKLGLVALSNFDDSTIRNIINIPEEETLIYIVPFGQIKD